MIAYLSLIRRYTTDGGKVAVVVDDLPVGQYQRDAQRMVHMFFQVAVYQLRPCAGLTICNLQVEPFVVILQLQVE